jgi:hypothetical protein
MTAVTRHVVPLDMTPQVTSYYRLNIGWRNQDMADMQWHVHKGRGGPVLVQYSLPNQQQLELWVNPPSIAEGKAGMQRGLWLAFLYDDGPQEGCLNAFSW